MTEPRTPDDQPIDAGTTQPATPPSGDPADSPTQAWPAPASAATGSTTEPGLIGSPYEPAESLPAARVGTVAGGSEGGTFGAAPAPKGGRSRLRWGLALIGVLIVAAGSFAIVSLVGGRPTPSPAMGYMPASTFSYTEIRLDLPGDQRQKVAAFLQAFPGFKDQSAIEPKIDEVFDRIVKAASHDQQTWTADIKPWFSGQIALGAGAPSDQSMTMLGTPTGGDSLFAATVSDRAKAIAWLTKSASSSGAVTLNRSTYGRRSFARGAEGLP